MKKYKTVIIGGGASGIFGAIHAKEALVLEKSAKLLSKVRISGGGRCNVTHACFDPKSLIENYPRGSRELLGPFHKFGPEQTIEWFTTQGVTLKTESDGRIFPITDSSQTIIDALLQAAKQIDIRPKHKVLSIEKKEHFHIHLKDQEIECKNLLLATGGAGFEFAKSLGHTIIPPLPSLFTFNVPTSPLLDLSGIVVDPVCLTLGPYSSEGPLLLTHFGFSGPAVLKLSAFAARYLAEKNYAAELKIEWKGHISRRLKKRLDPDLTYKIQGKSTNKAEFVTAGGVKLSEVDFRTMESKICKGLYFAGEVLDIDGITGGFNFQNAWTTSYLAGAAIANSTGQTP